MTAGRWRLLFWAALVFAFVMAIVPHPPRLPGEPSDKVQHIIAFVTLTLLGCAAFGRGAWVRLLICLSLYGALIEVVQAIPQIHRDSDVIDWLADTAAVATVLVLARLFRR